MDNVTKVISDLHQLSPEEVVKVLDFIKELKSYSPKPGSVDAVMGSFGS